MGGFFMLWIYVIISDVGESILCLQRISEPRS